MSADAAAGVITLKRPAEDELHPPTELKKFAPMTTDIPAVPDATPTPTISTVTVMTKPDGTTVTTTTVTTTVDNSKRGRQIRLEQNRKAARESRKRKKVMVEELQRSVVFFSRANNTLKQQNEELTRLMMQAQEHTKNAKVTGSVVEGKTEAVATVSTDAAAAVDSADSATAGVDSAASTTERESISIKEQLKKATIVATQALLESQGFPAAAARAASQAMNSTGSATAATVFDHFSTTTNSLSNNSSAMMAPPPPPQMQPGATMQAMANFQQAAAAAMQTALQGMTGVNGLSLLQSVLQPPPGNVTQNFTDTMTAIAMHQAAAQHMGQQQLQQQMLISTAVTPTVSMATTAPNEAVTKEEDTKEVI